MSDSDSDEPEEDPWWTEESLPRIVRAALEGDLQTVRRELAAGASPFAPPEHPHRDHYNMSPIHLVCERRDGRGYIVSYLSSRHAAEPQAEEQDRAAIVEELLAAGVPPGQMDDRSEWSVSRFASYFNRPLILEVLIKAAGPHAAAMVCGVSSNRWTDLQTASRAGHTECVRLLLSAGAGSGIDLRNPQNQTALECAAEEVHPFCCRRTVYGMLLAAGATIPSDTSDPYLQKVRAVGFPAYEKAHRQTLVALAAKAFPRLPTEVAGHVVAFAFHVGYY